MKAHIKAHFTTNENIMIKLHIKLLIKVVIHSYLQWSLSLVDPVLEVVGPGLGFL